MADTRMTPEAPTAPKHVAIYREDYRPPDWQVPTVSLELELDAAKTRVVGTLSVRRNGNHDRPLRLAGDGLRPLSVKVDGGDARWTLDGDDLVIAVDGDHAEVMTEVEIAPDANSQLMGLYSSGGLLCTQCESEGFRRITFHPDRPDILATYSVLMHADKARYPILLANGNKVAEGEHGDGRHWARWDDPFPKPSYLFALVAGDLVANRDQFKTMSGRTVDLAVWVDQKDLSKTQHAMDSLKAAMKWDEEVYGREYDLDLFNIVAVADFNFGAMENKGLNIFNSRYVLADEETATDADFDNIAGVVAHEYFHNWSGNRVTCRDWFQLSLKEGFTVFRDQSFSQDMSSAAVKRIDDVRLLRAAQFLEDSGPLAHPVRPDSYIEITNFYTATIYNKGAELIRMLHTMLGAATFRKATDLYFERHDGQAVTCEDFVQAMEDASGIDLRQFRLWYSQAGTPHIRASLDHDAGSSTATLNLAQTIPDTPGQTDKQPMAIPLKTALISAQSGEQIGEERMILLTEAEAGVQFDDIHEPVLLSINRDFSAPVILDVKRADGELEALAAHDPNPFARYEASQELIMQSLLAALAQGQPPACEAVIAAIRHTIADPRLDRALKASAIIVPSESVIGERLKIIDPDAVHATREAMRSAIGKALAAEMASLQADGAPGNDRSSEAMGKRSLRAVALAYLAAGDPARGATLAKAQYDGADNMTDRQSALMVLASLRADQRDEAFADFHARYRGDELVLDKWFALQAAAQRDDTLQTVDALTRHPDFSLKNPNRLRSLIGGFGANQWALHHASGDGYALLARMVIAADKLNPQVAARLVTPLGRWRHFEPQRSVKMRAALEEIAGAGDLSKDVFEQVSKSLS